MVVPRVWWPFGHIHLPELLVRRLCHVKSRHWRNFMSIHRSDEFGCDQNQQLVLFVSHRFVAEEQRSHMGDVAQQRDSLHLRCHAVRKQSCHRHRLAFSHFDDRINSPCIQPRNPRDDVCRTDVAVFGDDPDSYAIAIDNRRCRLNCRTETTERSRRPRSTAHSDNGGNGKLTTGQESRRSATEHRRGRLGQNLGRTIRTQPVEENSNLAILERSAERTSSRTQR